jgi:hypothetical protein
MKANLVGTIVAIGALAGTTFAGPGTAGASPVAGPASGHVQAAKVSAKEKAAVIAWVTAHESAFTKLETGFDSASTAASKDKIATLHRDCVSLKTVITGVQALPHIPDPTIEAVFKSALTNLMDGTVDCVSGTSTDGSVKPALLTTASKYWETGGNQLIKVGQDLDALAS